MKILARNAGIFKKGGCCLLAIVGFWLLIANSLFAQGERYTRKSVAFVDALMVTNQNIRINPADERYFLATIHNGISISRFDYNPLPDTIRHVFKERLRAKGTVTESELVELIETAIVPEIIKILDIEKEIRAQNLVDETQRNSFIVVKAKEIGITAEQIEQVMNASYLYLPFLSSYRVSKSKDDKNLTVTIKGGLLWYHIIAGDDPHLESIVTLTTETAGSAEKDKSNAESIALREAAGSMAMNLQVQTREINIFRLNTPIASVERRTISFPLGRAEGIKLDDPFHVGEYIQSADGEVHFRKSGFVRVSTVSDNRQNPRQLSAAYAIQKGDWVKGMTMIEHPRLGIDVAIRPRWFTINAESGFMMSLKEGFVVYFDDYSGSTLGLDVNLHWNIAGLVKKRQTFLVMGGTASLIPVESVIFDYKHWDEDYKWKDLIPVHSWVAGLYYGYVGYLKRFYLGPLAIHGEASLGTQIVSIGKIRGSDYYEGEKVTISNYTIGARLNVGLEYAVNIDWNVGIFAGVQAFPPLDLWTVKYDDEEIDVKNVSGWIAPKFYSYSPSFGIYIHYSVPTLSVNPFSSLQAGMDKIK